MTSACNKTRMILTFFSVPASAPKIAPSRILAAVVLSLAIFLAAVPPSAQAQSCAQFHGEYPYKAVATVGMVADIVRVVAGDKAQLRALMGPGVDPHLYAPTRRDVARLLDADIVFYSGQMLEGRMTGLLEKVGRRRPAFAVTGAIARDWLLAREGAGGHPDPHVWMDVSGWTMATRHATDALCDFDPPNAALYHKNSEAYLVELKVLDDYARRCIASIPASQRLIITAHDAFSYFGRAYGIEVRGIQGLSTESEAGLRDVNRLVDLIVARGVPAIFVETSVSDKNVKALIEGVGARGRSLRIGGSLFSDAMGAAGTYEGTYIGMIDHNVTTITRALGGNAPERGMKGLLAAPAKNANTASERKESR